MNSRCRRLRLEDVRVESDRGYARQRDFNIRTNCVQYLYNRCLPRVETGNFFRIIVVATEDDSKDRVIEELLDVVRVTIAFDFEAFWASSSDEFECKRRILELIQIGVLAVACDLNWPTEPFHQAQIYCLDRKLIVQEYVNKPVSSPDRYWRAQTFFSCGLETVRIFVVITDKAGERVLSFPVAEVPSTGKGTFEDYLGKLKWLDGNTVRLVSKSGKCRWDFS